MEVYKLGKFIENQGIEIQLILHQLDEAREELKKFLKRRKEIAIAENDTQYKEIDTTKLFSNGDSNEFDSTIVDLMENHRVQAKEIRNLKLDQESQAILLCEVTKQNKKDMEEKSAELTMISNMQLDTLSQMMNSNYELNVKYIEITTLKLQNEQLQSDL